MSANSELIETSVDQLDLLLGGGIPPRHSIIVTGDPGTGKTILCSQIAFAQAARGNRVVLATVASEAHDKLVDELSGFSFFDGERLGNELYMVSAYPWLQKGPKEAKDLLLRTMRERKAKLLFVDGLRSLRDLWQNESKLRDFLYEMNVGLAQMGAVWLMTTEYPLQRLMTYPEATTVDGIVALSAHRFGGRMARRIQVSKLRGRKHLTGEHLMHITDQGITIVPRLEEITHPEQQFKPSPGRCEFGLPELDSILHGGLPNRSTTLLTGSTGVGKTLLSLHFAATGARKGESSYLVTYSEPVGRLTARARQVGLDVSDLLGGGNLHLSYRSPINVETDDLVSEILAEVKKHHVKRLVIDGLGELSDNIIEKDRTRGLLSALTVQLRDLGVTSVFVKEVPKVGPDLDLSDNPLSVTAENLLLFRHVERRGRLHRVVSILKMRESGYDPYVREFDISEKGIRVLRELDSVSAPYPSEVSGHGEGHHRGG